jgi:hypothetical protein
MLSAEVVADKAFSRLIRSNLYTLKICARQSTAEIKKPVITPATY